MSYPILKEQLRKTFSSIRVYDIPELVKERFGPSDSDGGYVFAKNLVKHPQFLYSFGVGENDVFERVMCSYVSKVFAYDWEERDCEKDPQNLFFERRGISENFFYDTLFGYDSILKIDVEGAEWEVLDSIAETALFPFAQIGIEFHFWYVPPVFPGDFSPYFTKVLGEFYSNVNLFLFERYQRVLEKIQRTFFCFHIHANNSLPGSCVEEVFFPPLLEMSFVNKRLTGRAQKLSKQYFPMMDLDVPNKSDRPDYRDVLNVLKGLY